MINEERLKMLYEYIKANVSPILIENVNKNIFLEDAVIIDAKCDRTLLDGHYEKDKYLPPSWYNELEGKILIIDNIDSISKYEQMKFYEILKYRKVSVFELPKNCVIIVTCTNINEDRINENIYSLVSHI